MQSKIRSHLFQMFCQAFPKSNVRILRNETDIVMKRNCYPNISEEDEHFYTVIYPFASEYKLMLSVFAANYQSQGEVERMASTLVQMSGVYRDTARGSEFSDNEEKRLLRMLLHAESFELKVYAVLLAERLQKDLTLERVVCLIENRYESSNMVELIKRHRRTSHQDLCESIGDVRIMLCRYISNSQMTIQNQCSDYLQDIQKLIHEKYGYLPNIYVGTVARKAEEYRFSFNAARTMEMLIRTGDTLERKGMDQHIFYVRDYIVEYTLYNTDREILTHFLAPYVTKLQEYPELLRTARILVESDMNISIAAKKSYVHRNTLSLHAKKLGTLLKMNMMNDGDRFLLMLICEYCESNTR